MTDWVNKLNGVPPKRKNSADHQIDRNKTLHWTVIQVYCSYTAHFEQQDNIDDYTRIHNCDDVQPGPYLRVLRDQPPKYDLSF